MVLKRFSVVFSMFWTLYWIRFGPLWILKYIGDVWGSVAHIGFFLWFPVVFDGFKAVFSGFKSVVNNLLMIKHLKIYAFCFLCTLKFLGTGWARSPAFWVCLTSTPSAPLVPMKPMQRNSYLESYQNILGCTSHNATAIQQATSSRICLLMQQNSIYPRGHQTKPSHTKPKYN